MRLNCVRTNSVSGKETIEVHKAEIRGGSGDELWVYLVPGVTGYESASVKHLVNNGKFKDWCACAGTPGSWDKLFVPEDELERLKDVLRLIPIPETND